MTKDFAEYDDEDAKALILSHFQHDEEDVGFGQVTLEDIYRRYIAGGFDWDDLVQTVAVALRSGFYDGYTAALGVKN